MGDLYGGGQGALVATYLALFWNRFCGMDIGLTQSVIGMSAILSAFAALGFGVLCDNFYRFRIGRRFGRRRLVLAFVAPTVLGGLPAVGSRTPDVPVLPGVRGVGHAGAAVWHIV